MIMRQLLFFLIIYCILMLNLSTSYKQFSTHDGFQTSLLTEPPHEIMERSDDYKCGQRTTFYISDGAFGSVPTWPWLALIFKREREKFDTKRVYCSGILISKWFVLTAAHCTIKKTNKDLIVHLGKNDIAVISSEMEKNIETGKNTDTYQVDKIIVHPEYVHGSGINNLALLELRSQVNYSENISPVCLPMAGFPEETFNKKLGTATGWGRSKCGGEFNHILQDDSYEIIANEDCQNRHMSLNITKTFLCADHRYGDQDTCQGDSGGALMLKQGYQWVAIGVTSLGSICAPSCMTAIYTRLSEYVDWMQNYTTDIQFA